VAVALSWLENDGLEVFQPSEEEPGKSRKKRKTHEEQIRERQLVAVVPFRDYYAQCGSSLCER
jgi:hypothetical protein